MRDSAWSSNAPDQHNNFTTPAVQWNCDEPGGEPLKVLQVATLASSTGAYGGPIAVAESQTRALREIDIDAVLIAGQRAVDRPPSPESWEQFVDVRRILPTPGFTGYFSRAIFVALWRGVGRADILHVQLGRELVPLVATIFAILRRRVVVAQCHGMIMPPTSTLRKLLDFAITRPILRRINHFLVYNQAEQVGINTVAHKSVAYRLLLNGADLPTTWSRTPPLDTAGTWQIVFAARLHPRKRVALFIAMAERLVHEFPDSLNFTVYGGDEGDIAVVRNAAAAGIITYAGPLPLDDLRVVLGSTDILVLPSAHEPFSVTILDAQARGCPVIVSDTNGFATYVTQWGSGAVFLTDDLASLKAEVTAIISDDSKYRGMRLQARALMEREFSWVAVADTLSTYYREAMTSQ